MAQRTTQLAVRPGYACQELILSGFSFTFAVWTVPILGSAFAFSFSSRPETSVFAAVGDSLTCLLMGDKCLLQIRDLLHHLFEVTFKLLHNMSILITLGN